MCLREWWCPPLRSCLCLVSLHSPNSELLGVLNAVLRCPPWCWMVCPPSRVSCLPLSPLVSLLVSLCRMVCPLPDGFVSPCLPLSPRTPFLFPFVGWCARLLEGLVSPCLPLLDGVFPRVLSPLVSSLSPFLSPCAPLCHLSPRWMVCLPSPESCLPLSPFLFPFLFPFFLPFLFPFVGWCLLPEGLVSPFLRLTPLLPLLVSLCWVVCPPSRGDKLTPLVSPCLPSWSPSGVLLGVLNAFLRWPPWC